MRVEEFKEVMRKVESFKMKLIRERIRKEDRDLILKLYMSELTSRINTNLLKVV